MYVFNAVYAFLVVLYDHAIADEAAEVNDEAKSGLSKLIIFDLRVSKLSLIHW